MSDADWFSGFISLEEASFKVEEDNDGDRKFSFVSSVCWESILIDVRIPLNTLEGHYIDNAVPQLNYSY